MKLRPINTTDPVYPEAHALWLAAFPVAERRPGAEQCRYIDHNPMLKCYVAEDTDGRMLGLITLWDFDRFAYCEHLATRPDVRGSGIGGRMVEAAVAMLGKPLVLEVERPEESDMAARRVEFYRRHGLRLWDGIDYVQPPYAPDRNAMPMRLMATDGLSPAEAPLVIASLRRDVYGVG